MLLADASHSADWLALGRAAVALFAIVDPLGNVPLFLSITADQSAAARKRTALVASLATAAILVGTVLGGPAILGFFGIRVASFQVGGGLLLLLIGLSMLHSRMSPARQTNDELSEAVDAQNVAIVPLAVPLMAGPGAIGLLVSETQRVGTWSGRFGLVAIVIAVAAATWLVLQVAEILDRRIRRTTIHVVTRLMGLILVAIAVEMMAAGLVTLFPVLGGAGGA
jgi:MarC family membrane protein